VESPTQFGADAQLQRAREICGSNGIEGDDVFPRAFKAKPYSIRGFVGPSGERWAPVHGIFSLSNSRHAMAHLQSSVATQSPQMAELDVTASWLLSSSGPYVTIEPMLYWRDRLEPIHMDTCLPETANVSVLSQPIRPHGNSFGLCAKDCGISWMPTGRFIPNLGAFIAPAIHLSTALMPC
jgi:hypothetical protein